MIVEAAFNYGFFELTCGYGLASGSRCTFSAYWYPCSASAYILALIRPVVVVAFGASGHPTASSRTRGK
jgi:hypothetical protein